MPKSKICYLKIRPDKSLKIVKSMQMLIKLRLSLHPIPDCEIGRGVSGIAESLNVNHFSLFRASAICCADCAPNWRNDYLRGSQGAYGGGQIGAQSAQQMADALNKEK
jgi:hypothetical protein